MVYVLVIHNWTDNKRVAFGYTDKEKFTAYRKAISTALYDYPNISGGKTKAVNRHP